MTTCPTYGKGAAQARFPTSAPEKDGPRGGGRVSKGPLAHQAEPLEQLVSESTPYV